MLKLLKWCFGLLAILVIALLLAIVLVPRTIDPNDYRQQISELVREHSGRDLQIAGDLSVSVFPWLGIQAQQVRLSQPEGVAEGDWLSVEEAQLRVKVLPLFSRRVEVDTVRLIEPTVHFVTLSDGRSSLDGLVNSANGDSGDQASAGKQSDKRAEQSSKEQVNSATDSKPSFASTFGIALSGLEIDNATVIWEDHQANSKARAKGLTLNLGDVFSGQSVPFNLAGDISMNEAGQESLPSTRVELEGLLAADISNKQADLSDVVLVVEQQGKRIKGLVKTIKADANNNVHLSDLAGKIVLPDLAGELDGFALGLKVSALRFNGQKKHLAVSNIGVDSEIGKVLDKPLTLATGIAEFGYSLADQAGNTQNVLLQGQLGSRPFSLKVDQSQINVGGENISVPNIRLDSEDLALTLNALKLKNFTQPDISVDIKTNRFNLQSILSLIDVDYQPQDQKALTRFAVNTKVNAKSDRIALRDLTVELDDTTAKGNLSVRDFATPDVDFDIRLDQITVDQYLPLENTSTTSPVVASNVTSNASSNNQASSVSESIQSSPINEPSLAEAMVVPMALFEQFKANGELRIDQLRSVGLQLNDIDVRVVSSDNRVEIIPKANLYEGSIAGNVVYQKTASGGELKFKNQLDLVDLSRLLTAADITDQLSGVGSLGLNLVVKDVNGQQSNQGSIRLSAKNGAIKGIDIKKILDNAKARYDSLRGKEVEQGEFDENDETRFAELAGTLQLDNFSIKNQDFSLKAPLFRVLGEGDINLNQDTLDYLLSVVVVNTSKGQGGESLENLKGVRLPFRLFGSVTAPKYRLDLKELVKARADRKVAEEKERYLQEKYGIESGGKLSTKEVLRSVLSKKVDKELGRDQDRDKNASPTPSPEAEQDTEADSAPVEDVVADPQLEADAEQAKPLTREERKQAAKEQLEDELKNRALDWLFK